MTLKRHLPLSVGLAAFLLTCLGSAAEPARRDIEQYSELWTEPLFAQPAAIEEPVEEPAEPAQELELTGWGQIEGEWVASVYDRRSGIYHFLRAGEFSQGDLLVLVDLQTSAVETKALVKVKDCLLWITPDAAPTPAAVAVEEAQEVDSRSAMLTESRVLTAVETSSSQDSSAARMAERLHQKALADRHRRLRLRFPDRLEKLAANGAHFAD